MALTAPQIRCLLAVRSLGGEHTGVASRNVAKLLGISRPAVHKMLDMLTREEWLSKAYYGTAQLTPEGAALAAALEERREWLFLLFSRRLGLPPEESSLAAVTLMSELSEESLKRLEETAQKTEKTTA